MQNPLSSFSTYPPVAAGKLDGFKPSSLFREERGAISPVAITGGLGMTLVMCAFFSSRQVGAAGAALVLSDVDGEADVRQSVLWPEVLR
jgi:hypothetical protein